MDKAFIDILQSLISEQGKEALLNQSKCKAFLADYTRGEYKRESRLLLQAVEVGAQKAIDAASDIALCKQQQTQVLREEFSLTEEVAADVVDTLALVLRGEKIVPRAEAPKEAPKPEAPPTPKAAPVKEVKPDTVPTAKPVSGKKALVVGTVIFIAIAILLFALYQNRSGVRAGSASSGSNASSISSGSSASNGEWTAAANSPFDDAINAIAYGGGRFVAVGHDGKMAYSTDGATWTAVSNSRFGDDTIWDIAYGNNRWVAVGYGKMAYSSDGVSWTAVANCPFNDEILAVAGGINAGGTNAAGNGRFVAVGWEGMAYADW